MKTDNNRYANSKIYKLWRLDCDDIYIGSTTQELYKCLHEHKRGFDSWKNGKGNFVTSYKLFELSDDLSDVKIELIEYFNCETKAELEKREGQHIRAIECLNKVVAGRTKQESNKAYYQDKRAKICEKRNEKITCDCGFVGTKCNLTRHKKTVKHKSWQEKQSQTSQQTQSPQASN